MHAKLQNIPTAFRKKTIKTSPDLPQITYTDLKCAHMCFVGVEMIKTYYQRQKCIS